MPEVEYLRVIERNQLRSLWLEEAGGGDWWRQGSLGASAEAAAPAARLRISSGRWTDGWMKRWIQGFTICLQKRNLDEQEEEGRRRRRCGRKKEEAGGEQKGSRGSPN